ncbi:DNA polymerase, partial [Escherichia coli]|nr:DNA polymerase [Escherichia coli]
MMQKLWLDLETFSEIPIKNGTHVYAEGVEIMLFAWAIDEDPVSVHDLTTDYNLPTRLLTALSDESVLIYAHNSHFDRTMLRHALLHTPQCVVAGSAKRWRDTMVQALAHGLPGSLGELCEILGVPQDKAKDKEGKALIQLFCKPR